MKLSGDRGTYTILTIIKEGNVLFNDALNTFYLRLYGVIHMVKDHSDSERGNPLPPHGLLFPISSKRITHTTAFVTPVVTIIKIPDWTLLKILLFIPGCSQPACCRVEGRGAPTFGNLITKSRMPLLACERT